MDQNESLVKARAERVSNEHSYGTRQRLASIRETDHPYSTKIIPLENEEISEDPLCLKHHENQENVELVQLLSVVKNEEPPPGSSIIAQAEPVERLTGSAKRKVSVRLKKMNEYPAKKSKIEKDVKKTKALTPIGDDPHECELCGKVFPFSYRLNLHILEVHKKEKRHGCQYCDKSFFKLSSKKRHELTHIEH